MSKRKVNFGAITSEAARRQLMVPTPCWERVSVTPEDAAPGATWKVHRWIKTDQKQMFEEEEVDQPLAPLQDVEEIETNEEDTENAEDTPTGENSRAVSELPQAKDDTPSRPITPKPHPLSISFQPPSPTPAPQEEENIEVDTDVLTATTTLDPGLVDPGLVDPGLVDPGLVDPGLVGAEELNPHDIMHMNMADLGPDGEPFEGAGDLLQVQEGDDLLGSGGLMDQTGDPFQDVQ